MLKFLPKPTAPALETVGNITITDGVATGFTASNVLKSPSTFDYSQDNYEICGRFSLTDATPDNTIFRSLDGGGATIQVIDGKIVMFIMFGTDVSSTRYDINYTISNNQIYSFKFKRTNGTKYSLLVVTGNNVPTDEMWSVNNSSDLVNGQSYNIAFGGGSDSLTNQYLRGSIYLKGTYITVNNQLVCGEVLDKDEPDKIIIDNGTPQTGPVALEATGNVTITDGVATGFSATSVLKTGQGFDFSQPNYQIRCRFKCTGQSGTTPIFRAYEESSFLVGPTNANTVEAYIRFANESANTKYPNIITNFLTGKIYEFVFERVNGTYYQLSIVNITDNNFAGAYKWDRTQDIYPGNATVPISFGGGRADASSSYLRGELYTDYTYISVGGQLWSGTLPAERDSDYLIVDNKLAWVNPNVYLYIGQTATNPIKFFRTNIQLNSNSKVEMIFKPSQYTTNYCLWCCRNDTQNKTFSMFNVSSNYRFDYGTTQTQIGSSTSLTKTNITVDGNKAYVNGTLKATATAQTFTPDYGMVIFASNTDGGTTYGNGFDGKFYSMKIYLDGTNLSYHFVPVSGGITIGTYTTPSTGLFDLVNQQFYVNSGSGNFFLGKDQ